MGTQYIQPSDLVGPYGINPTALENVSLDAQQASCVSASATADSYFRTRYPLPLLEFGQDVVKYVTWIAVDELLVSRGRNPMLTGDNEIATRGQAAIKWFEGVAKQNINPDVTYSSPPSPTYTLPQVQSASPRGWFP
jgi:phage gp36-like protein